MILHGLKYLFEAATLVTMAFGVLSFIFAMAGDNPDNQAMTASIGDLFGIGFVIVGLVFFSGWWGLVHFGHLPWWR